MPTYEKISGWKYGIAIFSLSLAAILCIDGPTWAIQEGANFAELSVALQSDSKPQRFQAVYQIFELASSYKYGHYEKSQFDTAIPLLIDFVKSEPDSMIRCFSLAAVIFVIEPDSALAIVNNLMSLRDPNIDFAVFGISDLFFKKSLIPALLSRSNTADEPRKQMAERIRQHLIEDYLGDLGQDSRIQALEFVTDELSKVPLSSDIHAYIELRFRQGTSGIKKNAIMLLANQRITSSALRAALLRDVAQELPALDGIAKWRASQFIECNADSLMMLNFIQLLDDYTQHRYIKNAARTYNDSLYILRLVERVAENAPPNLRRELCDIIDNIQFTKKTARKYTGEFVELMIRDVPEIQQAVAYKLRKIDPNLVATVRKSIIDRFAGASPSTRAAIITALVHFDDRDDALRLGSSDSDTAVRVRTATHFSNETNNIYVAIDGIHDTRPVVYKEACGILAECEIRVECIPHLAELLSHSETQTVYVALKRLAPFLVDSPTIICYFIPFMTVDDDAIAELAVRSVDKVVGKTVVKLDMNLPDIKYILDSGTPQSRICVLRLLADTSVTPALIDQVLENIIYSMAYDDVQEMGWWPREKIRPLATNIVNNAGTMVFPRIVSYLDSSDPLMRRAATNLLADLETAAIPAAPRLLRLLDDSEPVVRCAVAEALGRIRPHEPVYTQALVRSMGDVEPSVRLAAVKAIAQRGGEEVPDAIPRLCKFLLEQNMEFRKASITTLGIMGASTDETIRGIRLCLDDPDADVRVEAIRALPRIIRDTPTALSLLVKMIDLSQDNEAIIVTALKELHRYSADAGAAIPSMLNMLSSIDKDQLSYGIVREAIQAFAAIGPNAAPAIPFLVDYLENELQKSYVSLWGLEEAFTALERIGIKNDTVALCLYSCLEKMSFDEKAVVSLLARLDPDRERMLMKCLGNPKVVTYTVTLLDSSDVARPSIQTKIREIAVIAADEYLRALLAGVLARYEATTWPITDALISAKDDNSLITGIYTLGNIRSNTDRAARELVSILVKANGEGNEHLCEAVMTGLAQIGSPALPHIDAALNTSESSTRRMLLLAVYRMVIFNKEFRQAAVPFLMRHIEDEDEPVKALAVLSLGNCETAARPATSLLINSLYDTSQQVRENALSALEAIQDDPNMVIPAVVRATKYLGSSERSRASRIIGSYPFDSAMPVFLQMSMDSDHYCRVYVAALMTALRPGLSENPLVKSIWMNCTSAPEPFLKTMSLHGSRPDILGMLSDRDELIFLYAAEYCASEDVRYYHDDQFDTNVLVNILRDKLNTRNSAVRATAWRSLRTLKKDWLPSAYSNDALQSAIMNADPIFRCAFWEKIMHPDEAQYYVTSNGTYGTIADSTYIHNRQAYTLMLGYVTESLPALLSDDCEMAGMLAAQMAGGLIQGYRHLVPQLVAAARSHASTDTYIRRLIFALTYSQDSRHIPVLMELLADRKTCLSHSEELDFARYIGCSFMPIVSRLVDRLVESREEDALLHGLRLLRATGFPRSEFTKDNSIRKKYLDALLKIMKNGNRPLRRAGIISLTYFDSWPVLLPFQGDSDPFVRLISKRLCLDDLYQCFSEADPSEVFAQRDAEWKPILHALFNADNNHSSYGTQIMDLQYGFYVSSEIRIIIEGLKHEDWRVRRLTKERLATILQNVK